MIFTKPSPIASLNEGLLRLLSTYPDQNSALLDFYTKHARNDYLNAIQNFSGSKIALQADSPDSVRRVVPIAMVLGDVILFDCESYAGHRTVSMFPIADDIASPVLYAAGERDPETGRMGWASPRTLVLTLAAAFRLREDQLDKPQPKTGIEVPSIDDPLSFFGVDPITPDESWTITPFFRSAHELENQLGEACTLAAGITHLRIPKGDTLFEELHPLLAQGTVLYAPFLRLSNQQESSGTTCLKVRSLDSVLTTESPLAIDDNLQFPVDELEIPFLDGVPLKELAKIVSHESDSIESFRRQIGRMMEDLNQVDGPDAAKKCITDFKRDVIEDELERVRRACSKVARMNSLARAGAYVATAALSVAGILGLSTTSLITGTAGASMALINALYRSYEDKREARQSPMYFAWRLRKKG